MTYAYWNVGKRIIEQEQKGESKAKYGSYLLKRLSQELSDEYETGFSVANIRNCRQLYLTLPPESSVMGKIHWSHLRTIMRLTEPLPAKAGRFGGLLKQPRRSAFQFLFLYYVSPISKLSEFLRSCKSWFLMYSLIISSVTLPLLATKYSLAHRC